VIEAGKMAKELGIPFILNPAPARELPEELLGYATILTPNESEAELLTGMPVNSMAEIEAAAENLKSKGVTQVIITLGKQGAYVDMEGFQGVVPGFAVKAMDTTAAGDVFNGALGVALLENQNISDAIRFAHAAAAISVTKLGAQPSVPAKQDVQEFLEKN
jgi:ribokinase